MTPKQFWGFKKKEAETMTVEVKDKFNVKVKRKEHPSARKYPGGPSMEFGTALRKFLSDLEPAEFEELQNGELIFEEHVTAEFFDSIRVGDTIGIGVLEGFEGEPTAYQFEVLSINVNDDIMCVKDVSIDEKSAKKYIDPNFKAPERELTFEEISVAFGMGFGEILMRDGRPYGVSEEIEREIVLVGEKEEEYSSEENKDSDVTNK